MAIFDKIKSTVLTEYKADTKQMRGELKKLSGEEAKRHKALIDQTEAQNKKLDDQIAMWGKVAVGVGAVTAAYAALSAGLKTYQHNSKLAVATAGVDLGGLQKATKGLVDETRLLEFASSAMKGTFKLSQHEMEGALQGVLALRKGGADLADAMARVEKAVKEGSTEPLKDLGLVIKGAPNDTQEGLNAALAALNDHAREMGDTGLAGDDLQRGIVKGANAFDNMSESLGRLAVAFGPVINAMADVLGQIADLPEWASDKLAGVDASDKHTSRAGLLKSQRDKINRDLANPNTLPFARKILQRRLAMLETQFADITPSMGPTLPDGFTESGGPPITPTSKRRSGKGGKRGPVPLTAHERLAMENGSLHQSLLDNGGNEGIRAADQLAGDLTAMADAADLAERELAAIEKADALAAKRAKQDSIMTQIFGAPAEIDAQSAALEGLAMTFGGLTNAFGAGVNALITGSKGFGEAFKDAIGESLRAMAVEMSISALKHTAYGLASLAFMDGRGAAAHFSAAGTFAAGAVAAGAGARLLGAGQAPGAGAPSTAGTAGVGSSGGGTGAGGGSTQVFIVGNDFAGLPARQRESQWRQISRSAGVSIEGDVVIDG